jgi:hypothetical protein
MSSNSEQKDEEMMEEPALELAVSKITKQQSSKSVNKNVSSKPISKAKSRLSCKSKTS